MSKFMHLQFAADALLQKKTNEQVLSAHELQVMVALVCMLSVKC
jgi:hypothetical protein